MICSAFVTFFDCVPVDKRESLRSDLMEEGFEVLSSPSHGGGGCRIRWP